MSVSDVAETATYTEPLAIQAERFPAVIGWPSMTRGTIAHLRRQGKWPPEFAVGARTMILMSDVRAWLLDRKVNANVELAPRREKCRVAGRASAAKRRRAAALLEAVERAGEAA